MKRLILLALVSGLPFCAWLPAQMEPQPPREKPPLESSETAERRTHLEGLLDQCRNELQELERKGRRDAMPKVREKITDLERALHQGPGAAATGEPRERLKRIKREVEELKQQGHHEEAERLARQLDREVGWAGKSRPEGDMPPELAQRDRHVREAVENLHAAGMHELAERVAREWEVQKRGGQDEGRRRTEPRPPEANAVMERLERMEMAMRELREAMARMQQRLAEPDQSGKK